MNFNEGSALRRGEPDEAMVDIANYVVDYYIGSNEAFTTARYLLLDSLACAMLALRDPECTKHVGPLVPGASLPGGVKVPGTSYELDPAQAAYGIAAMIRWLGLNDRWLGTSWTHPSDNLGAILAAADYHSRRLVREGGKPVTIRDVLGWSIKAHEIQGCYALKNDFSALGFDESLLVRFASSAVATAILGGSKDDIVTAISHAWLDGASPRLFIDAPHAGPRQRWASGDAARRAVIHALNAMKGCIGYPAALSAKPGGFYDVLFRGHAFEFERRLGSYVMENTLFHVGFDAEFHAQSAIEAAIRLQPQLVGRLGQIERVVVEASDAGARRLDRSGPLTSAESRRTSLGYCVAVPLVFGRLTAADYTGEAAADPRIDALRGLVEVRENPQFSKDAKDPDKRHLANAVQVFFRDGSASERVVVDYPVGHRNRRGDAVPALLQKFETAVAGQLPAQRVRQILELARDTSRFESTPVHRFLDLFSFT